MAKVILKYETKVLEEFELGQGDMKIGRRPNSDITIDNMAVSGEHANIFTIGDDSFVQDLGSTNGTYVNNKKITKHHLKHAIPLRSVSIRSATSMKTKHSRQTTSPKPSLSRHQALAQPEPTRKLVCMC